MRLARLPFVALLTLALGVGASFAAPRRRLPRQLPPLPGKSLGTLKTKRWDGGYVTRYLAAQLDDRSGQELVIISRDPGNVRLRVYTWKQRTLQLLADRTAHMDHTFTALDLDGNGREALIGIDTANRLVTLRYERGKLRATEAGPRIESAIGSLTATGVRGEGRPELAAAISSGQPPELGADGHCAPLTLFRRSDGRWKRTWRQSIDSLQFRTELLAGDYHPHPGPELVVAHLPSEVSDSHFELFRWTGRRLERVTRVDSNANTSVGLQHWVGSLTRPGRAPAIVAATTFTVSDSEVPTRGELLQWRRGRLIATHRLPGEPAAVLDLDGSGQQAIVLEEDDRLQLWQPTGI